MTGQAKSTDTDSLQAFFHADFEKRRVWHPEELGAILEHQWQAPLKADLGGQSAEQARRLKLLCEADNLLLKSYGDVFTHRVPPVELLVMIKEFAKRNLSHADAVLPNEIAKLLYVLSIVVARVRSGYDIGGRDNETVRKNIEVVLAQPWLAPSVAELLREGLRVFDTPEGQNEERSDDGAP